MYAEVSCLDGWYTGVQFRFLDDPIVIVRELWWGTQIKTVAPDWYYMLGPHFNDLVGVCLFA